MPLDSVRAFDLQTRHQIYTEGYKLWNAQQFAPYARELGDIIGGTLGALPDGGLSELSATRFARLLADLKRKQSAVYDRWLDWQAREQRRFFEADLRMQKTLTLLQLAERNTPADDEPPAIPDEVRSVTAPLPEDEETGLVPFWWLSGSAAGLDALWAHIGRQYLPANGVLPQVFLLNFRNNGIDVVQRQIALGRANRETLQDTIKAIIGTAARNNADGKLATIYTQASAVTDTVLQHVGGLVSAGVYSQYFKRYEWISVIDGVTTDICRSRNRRQYRYGEGPLPPAHIRCRSKTAPVIDASEVPTTFHAWLGSQPTAVVRDILGPSKAASFEAGKLRAKDLPKFDDARPIPLSDFLGKIKLISTR